MTQIKIEVPANDHIALSAMADALQRIAAERTNVTEYFDGSEEVVETDSPLVKQCEEFKTPKGDDFVEPVDVEIARMDEEVKQYIDQVKDVDSFNVTLDRVEELHSEPTPTEQDDTLDADGLPWDKRIHSRGKTRLSDNSWRLARKPNDKTDEEWSAYVESVKSELKAVQDIPSDDTAISIEDITQAEINAGTLDEQCDDVSIVRQEAVTPPEAEFTAQQAIDVIGNTNDNPMDIVEPTADVETREGPFYWSHDESDSCGEVQTLEQLREMLDSDPLCNEINKESYDKRVEIGYDNGINNVTPPTAPTLAPPVIDTEANETPVAPVTPPTSLTPPVVEAPVVEPTVESSDQPSVTTFQELMLYITGNAKKRGADNDMIKATLAEVDPALTAIPLIATRADLIPKFVTALEAKLS